MRFLLGAGAPQQPLGWDPGCCPHSCAPSAAGQAPPSPGCHFCPLRVCGDRWGVSVSSGDGTLWRRALQGSGLGRAGPARPRGLVCNKGQSSCRGCACAGPPRVPAPRVSPGRGLCRAIMDPEPSTGITIPLDLSLPALSGDGPRASCSPRSCLVLARGDRATSAVPRESQSCDSSDNIPAVPHPEGWGTETLNTGRAVVHKIG